MPRSRTCGADPMSGPSCLFPLELTGQGLMQDVTSKRAKTAPQRSNTLQCEIISIVICWV